MEIDREFLTIEVGDHGEGFAVEAIPDPRDAENLLKPCGRGIFYMRRFMDEVTFRRRAGGGTMVTMKRKLSSKATKENQ
jgi:serine/threonine-protein kinase RsbW